LCVSERVRFQVSICGSGFCCGRWDCVGFLHTACVMFPQRHFQGQKVPKPESQCVLVCVCSRVLCVCVCVSGSREVFVIQRLNL